MQCYQDIVNVDFDFFDPIPDIDWHAIKRLLIQLFQSDSELFQLHLLTDLILSQPLLGSTVKCDGRESDPYAFLSIINLHTHNVRNSSQYIHSVHVSVYFFASQSHPSVKSLIEYLLQKSTSDKTLDTFLQSILSPTSTGQVGLVLSERLINMPVQIVPPMYQMLLDEIKWALEEVLNP
jgi:protein BCP1